MTAENYKKYLLNAKEKGIKVEPPVKSTRKDSRGQLYEHVDESRVAIWDEVFGKKEPEEKEKSKKSK